MLVRILGLYLQSLAATAILVLVVGWLVLALRKLRYKSMTLKERRASLYEVLLIAVMVIPILSFAVMGLILMVRV